MCGIAGGINIAADGSPVDRTVVANLNHWQRRRGPDGEGIWASPDMRVVFGHRRLAIIDTGVAGSQPMSDASGRWTITFNGEIYNYKQLRRELENAGCKFKTNSDTEVLINVVALWGEPGLLRLRGMYAFALWDARDQELWLVRDPYGVKPLYYAESSSCIWFASNARALASCVPISTRPDAAALVGFYLWGYVPEPFSWWADIKPVPAGHLVRLRPGGKAPEPREFTSIQSGYVSECASPIGIGDLRDVLLDSVRHHLVSDVPVGLFLSSGIDSTVLASLASELKAPLKTITLAFDEYRGTPYDEAPIAEDTARRFGTDHATIRISREGFEERLENFIASMDQPTTDGLNTFLVSEAAASQGLKVVLSGLGGDELFGGYPSFHQIPRLLALSRRLPHLDQIVGPLAEVFGAIRPSCVSPKWFGVLSHSGDIPHAYLLRRALFLQTELGEFLDEETLAEGLERLATVTSLTKSLERLIKARVSDYAQIAALETVWYMRNQPLRDTDWSSMAHGIEVRVPYVDYFLLRQLGPLIASDRPPNKADLAACGDALPKSVTRRAKTGFTTPVDVWIRKTTGISARGLRGWARYLARQFPVRSQV